MSYRSNEGLIGRYNSITNCWEYGYWLNSSFMIVYMSSTIKNK